MNCMSAPLGNTTQMSSKIPSDVPPRPHSFVAGQKCNVVGRRLADSNHRYNKGSLRERCNSLCTCAVCRVVEVFLLAYFSLVCCLGSDRYPSGNGVYSSRAWLVARGSETKPYMASEWSAYVVLCDFE